MMTTVVEIFGWRKIQRGICQKACRGKTSQERHLLLE